MKLFGNLKVSDSNLKIHDYSMNELKEKFGTPLYIIDEDYFRERIKAYRDTFKSEKFETNILYASKANLNIYISNICADENISMDAVSGGEIFTISKSNMDLDKIYFHGNNKLKKEIELAVEVGVGTIVIDNVSEITRLEDVLKEKNKTQKVLLRVNPGIDAHTHEYISTSKNDSKFGLSIFSDDIFEIIKRIDDSEFLDFKGIHAHIGSQVFREDSFFDEAKVMIDFAKEVCDKGIDISEINLGGGFGIYYTEEDTPFNLEKFLKNYIEFLENYLEEVNLEIEKVTIEPGRSLIANCGHTLYTIDTIKKTYGGKNFLFIDGGMTDNIRPALYGAKYEGAITSKVDNDKEEVYTVAGKCCESGDIIIKDIKLPVADEGDLFLVSSTGAYGYSMSSNYNRVEKPAMISVTKDEVKEIVKRETYEDLIRNDLREDK
ncbi:diaminopimelate decarboxylase [Peptoniphilus sp. MSJ-1]|uniref:Diaminopimelate decarboxylase n=1 Tax=Peptoniphilus ovalis TaxID=2841503 RepID=A0ABS6FIS9_9FIRM|nr:diaminopimelate decarboxylase [Peptoniphilus ovalis]MBU5670074.1 diaminopimelate decarboxylase [Peptoniphilus ovalis]